MSGDPVPSRRRFLQLAGATAAAAVAGTSVACNPPGDSADTAAGGEGASRPAGFHRPTLDALGEVALPESLGAEERRSAVTAFVAWVEGYAPVAEEMHGYGYADVRFLPSDPAPGWRAQLEGLDTLAQRMRGHPFSKLDATARREVLGAALAGVRVSRLPRPLGAPHVAVALLSHWTSSPRAWDLALGAQVGSGTCRSLDGVTNKPLPLANDGSRA